jgi:outer membrane lipoprotein-sorting protein
MVRWLFLLFWCFAQGVGAQGEGLSGKAKLDAFLEQMTKAQAGVRTLTAQFEQIKVSHLLKEPSRSRGVFYYQAPEQVRWEYQEPRPVVVLITARAMVTYRPQEKVAEKVELGRQQRKVFAFLSASEPIASLSRHFSFTLRDPGGEEPFTLVLTPVTHQIKKRIQMVELLVDRKSFLPTKVSYKEADGDVTTYLFSHIVVNGELPEGLFALDLPAGVRVVELQLRGSS